jgi:hypothetical protein
VTDRSDHWIGSFCRQIIAALKCFSGFRYDAPLTSPSLVSAAKQAGFLGEEFPGDILDGF